MRSETDRLPLAKLSLRTVTDPTNFSPVYGLYTVQANRNELEDYVNYFDEDLIVFNTDIKAGMQETTFNNLYQTIKSEYSINAQVNGITIAFNKAGSYFTARQASQLIQLINGESSRLSLAKLSYHTIVDPTNFSTVSNLLYTQSSRDELLSFINNGQVNILPGTMKTKSKFFITINLLLNKIVVGIAIQWMCIFTK